MNKSLRPQYLALLSEHGLKPRPIPPNATEIARANRDRMVKAARARGDHQMIEVIEQSYQAALKDTRHPTDRLLDSAAEWVEEAIRANPKYRAKFRRNVYVGEFPTGAFNAEVTPVKGGYLVLVNSGAMVLARTVYSLLAAQESLDHLDIDSDVVSAMGQVFKSYLQTGDPMFGPLNQAFGSDALMASALTQACHRFMIAHEYGHVLAGHLAGRSKRLGSLSTPAGEIKVSQKSWEMELAADLIAYELLIGADRPSNIDVSDLRRFESGDSTLMATVMGQAALIAAPFLFFAIDFLAQRVASSFSNPDAGFERSETHPSTADRLAQILSLFEDAPSGTTAFLSYAKSLTTIGNLLEQRARDETTSPSD